MAADNMAFITFENEATTFQMLAQLKQMAVAGELRVQNAVVVSHNPDGTLKIEDSAASGFGMGSSTGGLIGAVVGILGGRSACCSAGAPGRWSVACWIPAMP